MSGEGPPKFVLGGTPSKEPEEPVQASAQPTNRRVPDGVPTATHDQPSLDRQVTAETVWPSDVAAPQPVAASQAQPQPEPQHANASTEGCRSKGKLALFALLPLIAIAVIGFFLLRLLTGGSGAQLVIEPRSNGNFDVHRANFGDTLSNETEVLENVVLTGTFADLNVDRSVVRTGGNVLSTSDGDLIVYREDGDQDNVLALVNGDGVTELADGDGSVTVIQSGGDLTAVFNDFDSNRCTFYEINGFEAQRIGRGDTCSLFASRVVISDDDDVSVVEVGDGSERELGESNFFPQSSVDGNLILLQRRDEDALDSELEMILLDSSEPSQEIDLETGEMVDGVLTNGVLIRDGGFADGSITYVSAADGSRSELASSEGTIETTVSPDGSFVAMYTNEDVDVDQEPSEIDSELSLWVEGEAQVQQIAEFDGQMLSRFLDADRLITVDGDGVIWQTDPLGAHVELGEFDDFDTDDISFVDSQFLDDGGLIIEAASVDNDRQQYVHVSSDGVVSNLPEVNLLSAFAEGDTLIASVREDTSDDEFLLVEIVDGEFVEFDEADSFFRIQVSGGEVIYTAQTGEDPDDIEVRRHSLGSSEPPTVEFDEASIIADGTSPTFRTFN